jgi:hypothetical protein
VAYAELLVHHDLQMIDVMAVPVGSNLPLAKAQHQDVLDGLSAQVMIDSIDLVFVEKVQQFRIQCAR